MNYIFKIYNFIMSFGFSLPIWLFQLAIIYNLCNRVLGIREGREKYAFRSLVSMIAVFLLMPNNTNDIKFLIIVLGTIWLFRGGLAQKVCTALLGILVWIYCLGTAVILHKITGLSPQSNIGFQFLTCLAGNIIIEIVIKKIGNACMEEDFEKDGWLFASVSMVNYLIMGIMDDSITSDLNGMLSWLIIIGLLVLVDIFLYVYYERNILKKKQLKLATEFQKKNELEQLHYQRLEEVQGEFRSLAHDMNHYLNVLSNMKEDKLSVSQYELAEQIRVRIQETSRKVYCLRPVLNAILNEKETVAKESDIKMEVFVEPGFDVEKVDDFSIIGILSNLIDNAIEAAGKCEDKRWVHVHMFAVNDGKQKFIRVENSMVFEPVKKMRGFFTKKQDKKQHGYGLKNVQKLVECSGGILRLEAEAETFTAEVVL